MTARLLVFQLELSSVTGDAWMSHWYEDEPRMNAQLIFVFLALIAYAYLGYPLLLYSMTRIKNCGLEAKTAVSDSAPLPFISILVSAYNEEQVIEEKIKNTQRLDYPKERFELVIATDGCSDRTVELVKPSLSENVMLLEYKDRSGKTGVLNKSIQHCRGSIVVFSDANTYFRPDALRRFAAQFKDKKVGVVGGFLEFIDPNEKKLEKTYFDYDKFMKTLENQFGVLVGAHGGVYAIRKEAYEAIPNQSLIDDFLISMKIQIRGWRGVYDRNIIAEEEAPKGMKAEYNRRVRIGAGGYQAVGLLKELLLPSNTALLRLSFCYWSHKVLRWGGPFFLIFIFVASLSGLHDPVTRNFFLLQLGCYGLALAGYLWHVLWPKKKRWLILEAPLYFLSINIALFHGFLRYILGRQKAAWDRTKR